MKKIILLISLLFAVQSFYSQTYLADTVVFGLTRPICVSFFPNGNFIITQQQGLVRIFNSSGQQVSTFWNFTDSVNSQLEFGVLGVCLDPNYASNHYVYIYYTHLTPAGVRVVRLTENNNVGTNPVIIFQHYPTVGQRHIGGNIHFGHGGKLFIIIGENTASAQELTNPFGKLLRINSNGTIPTDNPFYDDGNPATGNDDRIWALGLRNSFDFCFSPFNDSIYASENGGNLCDEVNYISKGKNYGWPICEGYCSPYNPLYKQPMRIFGTPFNLPALTGILVYSGTVMPQFNNKLLIASSNGSSGGIFKCDLANPPAWDSISSVTLISPISYLSDLKQGPDGYIYAVKYNFNGLSFLLRLKTTPNEITNISSEIPNQFSLSQNYPNPFNPSSKVKFQMSKLSHAKLVVFDITGREIETLVDEELQPGTYEVGWDGSNFSSGIYYYTLQTEGFTETRKMVLLK